MHISMLRLGGFGGMPPPQKIFHHEITSETIFRLLLGGHADVRVLHAWISAFLAYRAVQDWFQVSNRLLVLQMRVVRLIVYCEWKLLEGRLAGRLRGHFVPFACSCLTSFNMWHITTTRLPNQCMCWPCVDVQ